MGQQVVEFTPPFIEEEGTLTPTKMGPVVYESESEGEDDLMVSGPIIPMTARVKVMMASLGSKEILLALLDSGCTRFLVSPQLIEKLGMRLRKLKNPIAFS